MNVEEITVAEAFDRSRPPELREVRFDKNKRITCYHCEREIDKLIVINNRIGVCTCGTILFDWRPTEQIHTPLNDLDQAIVDVIIRFCLVDVPLI